MKKLLFVLAFSLATAPLYCPTDSKTTPSTNGSGWIGVGVIVGLSVVSICGAKLYDTYYKQPSPSIESNNKQTPSLEELKAIVPAQTSERPNMAAATNEKIEPMPHFIESKPQTTLLTTEQLKPQQIKDQTVKKTTSAKDHMRTFDLNDSFNGTF